MNSNRRKLCAHNSSNANCEALTIRKGVDVHNRNFFISSPFIGRDPQSKTQIVENNRLDITPLQSGTVLKSPMGYVEPIEATIWRRRYKDLELSRQVRKSIFDNRDC